MMKVVMKRVKRAFQRSKLPGVMCVLNPYSGCSFGCRYCYAKFMGRWNPYGKWGEWVVVKENFPELAGKESRKQKIDGPVLMSSVTDPYQPIEARMKITMKTLEAIDKSANISILTKSLLVVRDIGLFRRFESIEVGITVNSFKGKGAELIEPNAPRAEPRIRALRKLHEAGIRTYAFVSPIIPGLTDVEWIVEKTRKFTDFYWFEFLNTRAAGHEFMNLLKREFPQSYEILRSSYEEYVREEIERIRGMGIEIMGIVRHS